MAEVSKKWTRHIPPQKNDNQDLIYPYYMLINLHTLSFTMWAWPYESIDSKSMFGMPWHSVIISNHPVIRQIICTEKRFAQNVKED